MNKNINHTTQKGKPTRGNWKRKMSLHMRTVARGQEGL